MPAAFLRRVLLIATVIVMVTGGLNLLVDPWGLRDARGVPGLNLRKPYLTHDRELIRWRRAERFCRNVEGPSLAIFGNSRAEIGFDPEDPAILATGMEAFNHAIPGAPLTTAANQLAWLEAAHCLPTRILIGVDFFDFVGGVELDPATLHKPSPSADLGFFGRSVFSLAGLGDSFTTLQLQNDPFGPELTERGFNPLREYHLEVRRYGHYQLFRQRAEEGATRWARKARTLLPASGKPGRDQAALEAFLERAARHGIPVDVVIYPYHAELRLIAERLRMQPLYEDWLRQMTATVRRIPVRADGNPAARLWNFGTIASPTMERIPPRGDRKTQLVNYWEPGHFKPELGRRVLQRVLQPASFSAEGSFGEELTMSNIDSAVLADRRTLESMLRDDGELVREVDSLPEFSRR